MSAAALLGVVAVAAGAGACASIVIPPTRRLAPRVRPYSLPARTALGCAELPSRDPAVSTRHALARLFGPPLLAIVRRASGFAASRGEDRLARLLHQAGERERTPDEQRVRQLAQGFAIGGLSGAAAAVVLRAPAAVLAAGVAGFVVGHTRSRRQLERRVASRAAQLRLELYTVNQLLALHVRTGAGPMQAVQRLVDRGSGAAVTDLRDVLAWIRGGTSEAAAFRRAGELTPEPNAARTYQLLAAGVERGVDLAGGLLALSEDIRDARREQLHKDAVRRRAAMLIPTIGILAPLMLLFIAAPLPSIVLGHR